MRPFTDLVERVRLASLSSERVLAALLRRLADGQGARDTLAATLWDSVAAADAHAFRHDDIQKAQDTYLKSTPDGLFRLAALDHLADALLLFDGDRFVVRPEKRLDYLRWIAHVDPAFLVGAALARRLRDHEIGVDSLDRFSHSQCALALPRPPAGKVWADNHVHLGGVSSVAAALMSLADSAQSFQVEKWRLPRRFHTLFGVAADQPAARLLHAFRQCGTALLAHHCRPAPDIDRLLGDDVAALLDHGISQHDLRPVRFDALAESFAPADGDLGQHLVALIAAKMRRHQPKDAFVLFATLVCLDDQRPDLPASRRAGVLALVHLAHALRQTIIMQGVGLGAFMGYFGSTPRKVGQKDQARLDWIAGDDNRRAEIKLTAPTKAGGDGEALHKRIEKLLDSPQDAARRRTGAVDRFHLCHHFSRSGTIKYAKTTPGYSALYGKRRDEVERQGRELARRLSIPRWHAIGDDGLRVNLVSLLRGFDVAGNENEHPIEVFAPTLRWLRDRPLIEADSGAQAAQSAPRRLLSLHAGEDFDHLLSGLRHVDETVKFCAMGAGDRLGHALALGLDPRHWAERQGTALVRQDRHLDNLVWLWHQALRLAPKVPVAATLLDDLERRIAFHAEHLGEADFSPDTRYRAWKLRRNCPKRVLAGDLDLAEARYWTPDYFDRTRAAGKAHELYERYLRRRLERDIPLLEVKLSGDGKPRIDSDHFGQAYLDLLEAVQDDRMTEYDRRGVVLEACPSSNLHISRIDSLEQHPALRWHPPRWALLEAGAVFNRFGLRNGRVRVCVNTDDPGVFPTDIVTEHHLLADAARTRFDLSQAETEDWKERLRQTGLEVFEQSHARLGFA